ncbi:putative importin [Encephalitozoon cuniculi]|nr:putative importin [Encephalitozoon cuniculi]
MEAKLCPDAQKVLNAIRHAVTSERVEDTPENIASAAVGTFLEMSRRRDYSRMQELLEIIIAHKDYIAENSSAELIRRILLDFKDKKIHLQGLQIIKHFIKSKRYSMAHFRILVEDCFGMKGLKTRSIELAKQYLKMDEFREELLSHISRLQGTELIRHINCFFDAIVDKADAVSKLDEFANPELFKDTGCSDVRALYSECCDLLYNYTSMEMKAEAPSEKTFEYIMEKLLVFFEIPLPRGGKLLKTFSLLAEKDLGAFLGSGMRLMQLSASLKKEIVRELCELNLKNEQIYEFIRSVRHILIPEFIDLIRHMARKFVEGDDRYRFALGTVVGIMGMEDLFLLLDGISKEVRVWAPVIRCSSNGDISLFIRLYRDIEERKGAASIDKTILLNCLPAFCNYGSDHNNSIEMLLQIMKANMSNPNVFNSICTGLRKLIHSHESNIKSQLVLRNPIPNGESQRILRSIQESAIALDVLSMAITRCSDELDQTLFKLLETNDLGLSNRVFQYILLYPQVESIAIGSWNLSGISDALKIARYFVPRMDCDFEIYSKLMELSLSEDGKIQKRAYQLLWHMKQHQKIDLCICDALFSHEMDEKTKDCSQKWRAALIYSVYTIGCRCFPGRKKEYLNRMLPVLVVGLKAGNAKTRRVCLESLEELVSGFCAEEFDLYCRLMIAGMASESVVLRCGILEAVVSLMENHRERLSQEFIQSAYDGCLSAGRLGREAVPHVLRLLNIFSGTHLVNLEGCLGVLELYTDEFRRRHAEDIKSVVSKLIRRDVEIPKKLKALLKERKRRGHQPILQITKKNDVMITQKKKKQSTPFTGHRRTVRPNKKHKK